MPFVLSLSKHARANALRRAQGDICGRPEWEKPLMIVVAGHPADDAAVPEHALRKKPLKQISSWI